jgi:hypothetical protein
LDVKELIIEQPQQGGPSPNVTTVPLGVGWNGYTHMAAPEFKISGIDMVPAYGALVSISHARPMQIDKTFYINPHSLGLLRGLMYFIEAHVLQNGVVLSSPSVNYALYLTTGRSSCIAKVELPAPPLATEQGLRHSFGTTAYEEIEKAALQRFTEADRTRGRNELLGLTELARVLGTTEAAVAGAIQTKEAKEALSALDSCDGRLCSAAEREASVSNFKKMAMANAGLSLFELVFVDMLSHRCLV